MNSFLVVVSAFIVFMVFFLVDHDHDVHELFLGAANALPMLMVFFLLNHDYDVHEFIS
jgi:hypothetical protein